MSDTEAADRARRFRGAIVLAVVLVSAALAGGLPCPTTPPPRAQQASQIHGEQSEELADFLLDLFDLADPERRGREEAPVRELLGQALGRDFVRARLERALASRRATYGPDHPATWRVLRALARLERDGGFYHKEAALLRQVAESVERVRGTVDADLAVALNRLGVAQGKAGDLAAAEASFQRAKEIYRTTPNPQLSLNLYRNHFAWIAELRGQFGLAELGYRRVLKWREVVLGRDHPETAWTLQHLGHVVAEQGRLKPAEHLLRRALAIREKTDGASSGAVAEILFGLGRIVAAQGRRDEATALLERSLKARLALLPPDHLDVRATRQALAELRAGESNG